MEKFSTKKRLKSFTYAWKGIGSFISKEHNAWIHLIIMAAVIVCGFLFQITVTEWTAIVLCIGLVLAAEAFNTSIERLVNLTSPEQNKIAGDVKDIAAGAVLICAIAAAIVGLIIFVPYLIQRF